MGAQKWFKFYGQEYLSDPKIERLSPVERSCWVTLMCMASLTEGRIRFLTVEGLITRSGVQFDPYEPAEWEQALGVLRKFQDLEMIECQDNGDIILRNWAKRQETNLTDAERSKSYRDRKKDSHANVTEHVTTVTQEKSRVDKIRVDKSIEEDITPAPVETPRYGEFKKVRITEEQYGKLIQDLGEQPTNTLILELDQYIATKGKDPYKDHYAVIKQWFRRKVQEFAAKNSKPIKKIQEF